jgi:Methyltransferase domain
MDTTARIRWIAGAVRLTLQEPVDGFDRILTRVRALGGGTPAVDYAPDAEWEPRLHALLGETWPCPVVEEFEHVWSRVEAVLRAKGLTMGRGTYGGWDDADPALARAVWCLTRHLRPAAVVETGVARGVTTHVILAALERNGGGRLWSIDLPALDPVLHEQIGAAVPDELRGRWSYVAGTSRRELPGLLSELGEVDLFVHDSSHTERNVRLELQRVWSVLRPGGAVVADDIDRSAGFADFVQSAPEGEALVARADDGRALIGFARKPR